MVILLDTGPLGLITKRRGHSVTVTECQQWAIELADAGHPIYVPEIADYEIRRELIRIGNSEGIARLEKFTKAEPGRYLPITTPVIRLAAAFWAESRKRGMQTASDAALDGDSIIAAHAYLLGKDVIVATENTKHLSQFVRADEWRNTRS